MKRPFLIGLTSGLIVSSMILYSRYKKDSRDYESPNMNICLNSITDKFETKSMSFDQFSNIWDWCLNNYEGF